jgi:hypothetical protein
MKIGSIDAHKYPNLVDLLQVKEYPSIRLLTEGGRLRPWPIEYPRSRDDIHRIMFEFLKSRQWLQIPVFMMLNNQLNSSFLSTMQIRIFNEIAMTIVIFFLKLFKFIFHYFFNHY